MIGTQPDPSAAALVSVAEATEHFTDDAEAAAKPPPERKLGSLIAFHIGAVKAMAYRMRDEADKACAAVESGDLHNVGDAVAKLDRLQNSTRSRLLQIRAIKDTAKAIGIRPGTFAADE
jgi:hypothetical protein